MKIILFIDYLCSGGAQRQLIELAKLTKMSVSRDVTVATYHAENILKPTLDEQKIKVQVINGAQNKYARIYRVFRFLLQEKPDIVVSYLDSPNMIACICHCLYPKFRLIVSERNTNQSFSVLDRVRFHLFRQAKYVIPNSFSQFEFISKHAPALRERLKVITNCVDTEKFAPKQDYSIKQPLRILTVARITQQKNIPNYLLALKTMKEQGFNFSAKWYGRYDDEKLYNLCLDLIHEYQLTDVFHFCGESTDLLPIYHDADLFCLPSLYEGFPNVVCEAMSTGLPIACSNVCDNASIVEEGINGVLFDPNDADSIAHGILRCFGLASEKMGTISIANREKMQTLCSKNQFIKRYQELFT